MTQRGNRWSIPEESPLSFRNRCVVRTLTVVCIALGATACYSANGRRRNPFGAPGSSDGSVRVRVENLNFSDATIHALRGGERVRLGQVTGKSESNFRIRWNFSLPMQLEVDLVGGSGCQIRPITVDPGDKVFLHIPIQIGSTPCYASKS